MSVYLNVIKTNITNITIYSKLKISVLAHASNKIPENKKAFLQSEERNYRILQ